MQRRPSRRGARLVELVTHTHELILELKRQLIERRKRPELSKPLEPLLGRRRKALNGLRQGQRC